MRLEYDEYQKKIMKSLFEETTLLFIFLAVIEMILYILTNYADAITRIFFITYVSMLFYLIRKLQKKVDLSPFSHISDRFFSKRSVRITKVVLVIITLISGAIVISQLLQGNTQAFFIDGQLAAFRSQTNFTTPLLSTLILITVHINTKLKHYPS